MGRLTYMAAVSQLKSDSKKKSTILLWVKNMLNKTLILLRILLVIYIMLFMTIRQVFNITIIIRLERVNMRLLHLAQKFFVLSGMLTSLTSSSSQTRSTTCKIRPRNSDLQAQTYSCSTYLIVWKTLNWIIYSKSLEVSFQQGSWQKKMENPKVLAS